MPLAKPVEPAEAVRPDQGAPEAAVPGPEAAQDPVSSPTGSGALPTLPGPAARPGPAAESGPAAVTHAAPDTRRVTPATAFAPGAAFIDSPTFAPIAEAAETTATTRIAPVQDRPGPAWRLWLVPLLLVGAIVVAAAALINQPSDTGETTAVPPPFTLAPPATGTVTIVPPSPTAASATPSASAASPSATPSPSASKSLAPTPSRVAAPAAPGATTGAPAQSGPITGASACSSGGTAVFAATFNTSFEWHHAFIDVDGNAATGYAVPDISARVGADYMVENDSVWRSTDSDWGWDEVSRNGLQFSQNGNAFRWQVPTSSIGSPSGSLRVVFNGAGGTPDVNSAVFTTGSC